MAKQSLNGVLHRIRSLAAVQTGRGRSDFELLTRFVGGEEAAFTVLVERHGPLVLGLCRRVLQNADDADDACQATFLVLARKASALRKRKGLGGWLHGVAYRVAANLRRQRARRLRREHSAASSPHRPHSPEGRDVTWGELQTVLDEELQRLPDRYRAPLILCYLDGKTRDEAAQEIGVSPGALHGLLERGRKLLRKRFSQRGVTLSAALFASAFSVSQTKAALSPALVIASTKAATAMLGGQPLCAVAPHVLSLAEEVMKVMFFTKLKIGTALFVCAGLLAALVGGALQSVSHAQDYDPATALLLTQAGDKAESDEEFLRRVSKDLRGVEPSPAEIHFFLANKDANRRQKVIDLFIQERQAKKKAEEKTQLSPYVRVLSASNDATARLWVYKKRSDLLVADSARLNKFTAIQRDFYKDLQAIKDNKDVASITANYLQRLMDYVKANPKAEDVPDAMLHISLIYRSQGKAVEADAWRDKLRKEHPKSNAAKTAQESPVRFWSLSVEDPEMMELYWQFAPSSTSAKEDSKQKKE
ncbi:MAG: sigma-70 family RNA polymerase sigma factor [Gemmataceae bacterium]|nr:sigma-70 family RNA polymerase sigma factor [Gemmataceae bacterium]MCI0741219.1 sigma-70 family RNA polymerase sigma factor [Gemmataceae bacterium]